MSKLEDKAISSLNDLIDAYRQRIAELTELVKDAYMEGYADCEPDGNSLDDWNCSNSKRYLG